MKLSAFGTITVSGPSVVHVMEKADYGATVFGEKETVNLGKFKGYNPLLIQIINFFESGTVPVRPEETLEICAFMEAADASKARDGKTVLLEEFIKKG